MTQPAQLQKKLGTLHLWAIAVGLVISGEYFGWSYGWASAGTLGFLAAMQRCGVQPTGALASKDRNLIPRTRTRGYSRARYAQGALKPDEVLPEWRKMRALNGGPQEVARFTERALERLRA